VLYTFALAAPCTKGLSESDEVWLLEDELDPAADLKFGNLKI
jgi:hypothetical protein